MSHRKWRETKLQLIWWPAVALLGCLLVSLHFLCDILYSHPVYLRAPSKTGSLRYNTCTYSAVPLWLRVPGSHDDSGIRLSRRKENVHFSLNVLGSLSGSIFSRVRRTPMWWGNQIHRSTLLYGTWGSKNVHESPRLQHPNFTIKLQGCRNFLEWKSDVVI